MKIDLTSNSIKLPFCLLRLLLPKLDSLADKEWCDSPLTRVVFHKSAKLSSNLSDRQKPEKQLRYYTAARINRGLKKIAEDYILSLNDAIDIFVNSFPAEPDAFFLKQIKAICNIHVVNCCEDNLIEDCETKKFNDYLDRLKNGTLQSREINIYLSSLLNYGDSWTAELFAKEYLTITPSIDLRLADVLGDAFLFTG